MTLSGSTFLCPYCYEEHHLSELVYHCTKCGTYKKLSPKNTGKGGPLTTLPPTSRICPTCGTSSPAVCPSRSCHRKLPEGTLSGKNTIISIVGTRGSGKSHYVGVLVHELCKRIAPDFGASIYSFDKSQALWQQKFGNRLYGEDAQALDATVYGKNDDPLIYEMILPGKHGNEMYTFVFFDTAGENFGDEELMSTLNKYIYKSAGLICLFDPFLIPDVREKLERTNPDAVKGSIDRSSGARTSNNEVLSHVTNLIRNYRGMRRTEKIETPLAVVFTKLDAIASLVPEGSTVLDPSQTNGRIDPNDLHNVNEEIQAFLLEWGEKAFITQINNDYNKHAFFGVSSLGFDNLPEGTDRLIHKPQPHRIEDPFLWILKENGILSSSWQEGFSRNGSRFSRVSRAAGETTQNRRRRLPLIIAVVVVALLLVAAFVFGLTQCAETPDTSTVDTTLPVASGTPAESADQISSRLTGPLPGYNILGPGADVGHDGVLSTKPITFDAYHGGTYDDVIYWRVLAVEEDKMLVIALNVIELRPYDTGSEPATWETCSLRQWLNNEFYNGLPEELKQCVLTTHLANERNPVTGATGGGNTEDKVFLLSVEEAERYFSSDSDRVAFLNATDEAIEWREKNWMEGADLPAFWGLRTPGVTNNSILYVYNDGSTRYYEGFSRASDRLGIRPAMWISLKEQD